MAFRFRKRKREVPADVFTRCDGCEKMVYKKAVDEGHKVCPECGWHFTMTGAERVALLLDSGSFEEIAADILPGDPLQFVDRKPYARRLAEAQETTGLTDAMMIGTGAMEGKKVVFGVMESEFIMASMGSVVGEKVTIAAETAAEQGVPLVIAAASGGARMQEGVLSLMQMAKTSAAVGRLNEAGGLYIAILTNPTTAGVMASFASLGDVIIAEPNALIGFTGPRVIQQTIKRELPAGFQRSEFLLDHGMIDMIVERKDLKKEVVRLLDYCKKSRR